MKPLLLGLGALGLVATFVFAALAWAFGQVDIALEDDSYE